MFKLKSRLSRATQACTATRTVWQFLKLSQSRLSQRQVYSNSQQASLRYNCYQNEGLAIVCLLIELFKYILRLNQLRTEL